MGISQSKVAADADLLPLQQAFAAFAAEKLPDTRISLDPAETRLAGQDARGLYSGPVIAVVAPASTADVARLLAYCNEHGLPVVPQGGNTSSSGGSVPTPDRPALILRLNRMNRIRQVDAINGAVTVDAGVTLGALKEHLRAQGFDFPLSIGSEGSCQIGGNIATNAGGSAVLRHGMMRDSVMGLEVVLADGRVIENLYGLRKVRLGYDLNGLFIGSEGTLGVITGAVLKMRVLPKSTVTAWVACASLAAVMDLLTRCKARFSESLESFEVMSRRLREVIADHLPAMRDPISPATYEWAVLIELQGPEDEAKLSDALAEALAEFCEEGLILDATLAQNEAQRSGFWQFRDGYAEATGRYGWEIVYDSSVPLSALPAFAERAGAAVTARWPEAEFVAGGHAGDGNIHLGFIFKREAIATRADYDRIEEEMNQIVFRIAHDLGGVFASEHPIGLHHVENLHSYAPPANLQLMHQIKGLLDPKGILNPGKVLRDRP